MPNIRLIIEYDGSHFHGWQRQPNLRTIQGELERIVRMVLREDIPVIHSAGRTDAGVHARGQVVNFHVEKECDLKRLKLSISSLMRGEVSVLSADYAPEDFHSRRSAISKQYSYKILQRDCPPALDKGKVWHIPVALDLELMQEEAKIFIGSHDFSSFRSKDCVQPSPFKTIIESEVIVDSPYVIYRVIGRGFLKQMVRIMVGTLVGRAKHYAWIKSIPEIFEAKDRSTAAMSAPAHGLYLDWVRY